MFFSRGKRLYEVFQVGCHWLGQYCRRSGFALRLFSHASNVGSKATEVTKVSSVLRASKGKTIGSKVMDRVNLKLISRLRLHWRASGTRAHGARLFTRCFNSFSTQAWPHTSPRRVKICRIVSHNGLLPRIREPSVAQKDSANALRLLAATQRPRTSGVRVADVG